MKTQLQKLSTREALALERAVRTREEARARLSEASRDADRALASIYSGKPLAKDSAVTMEELGEDVWLVLNEPDAPVDATMGGDGEPGMRAVPRESGGEMALDHAVRSDQP